MRALAMPLLLFPPLSGLIAQTATSDTAPALVVQRFVDGWNRRELDSMLVTVAPEAVFAELPSGVPFAVGRDRIRASYQADMARIAPGFTVRIDHRTVERAFVLDHETFVGPDGHESGGSTWLYLVTGGLIRRGWELIQPKPGAP